jgi:hypothetical protein
MNVCSSTSEQVNKAAAGQDIIRHSSNVVTWTWHLKRDSLFGDYVRRHDANHAKVEEAHEICREDVLRFIVERLKRLEQPSRETFTTAGDPELALALSDSVTEATFPRLHLPCIVQSSLHCIRNVKRLQN